MEIDYCQSPSDINSCKSLPSEEALKIVDNLPFSCADNPIIDSHNHNSEEDRPLINSRILISPMYKTVFLQDLFKAGFPIPTFAWNQCWESKWNQKFSNFSLNNCNYLHQEALTIFLINPKDNTQSNESSISRRWLRGKKKDLKHEKLSPEALSKKSRSKAEIKVA
ncbi:hypothetical protein O181_037555 [Austropuccinia psidii MF-1]|uniref:Uncharacterized protein n=1 Tax=Austropuccinia psidii MF-1 TaxID=1389203 RepID=A0A9Q3DB58_9BASI|nr:hypothetical protein [Austropuccinia psidii MF-1]